MKQTKLDLKKIKRDIKNFSNARKKFIEEYFKVWGTYQFILGSFETGVDVYDIREMFTGPQLKRK